MAAPHRPDAVRQGGLLEMNGYHMLGDPWREQRYTED